MAIIMQQNCKSYAELYKTMLYDKISLLLRRLSLALAALIATRIVFMIVNFSTLRIDSVLEFLMLVIGGVRFDISTIIFTHFFIILLHLWPGKFKYTLRADQLILWMYFAINGLLIAMNLIDTEYFDFTHKRSTIDLIFLAGVGNDILQMIPAFVQDFFYLIFVWAAFMLLLYRFFPRNTRARITVLKMKYRFVHEVVLALVTISALAATTQKIPGYVLLSTTDALSYTQRVENIPAVLNTPFSMIESLTRDNSTNIFQDSHQGYLNNIVKTYPTKNNSTPNVVVIILESFSSEYSKLLSGLPQGYTPFLDSLMQGSLYFTNAYANGKKSIEAVPSIICGVPALMTQPVITSEYARNNFSSLPNTLKDNGYTTAFYHGAANGSMGFEAFTQHIGVEHYVGMSQYPNPSDFDGQWGIPDEPFLQFTAHDLDSMPQPFMAGIFTISSHHPYTIPQQYKDTFPIGSIPMLRSIAYADHALRKFFAEAKKHHWYKNTLFVLTADHTGKPYTESHNNAVKNYHVPLIFYHPAAKLQDVNDEITQQIDIYPSVIDYLGFSDKFVAQGNSVFSDTARYATNYLNGVYQIIDNNWVLQHDGETAIGLYRYKQDSPLTNNLIYDHVKTAGRLEKQLKNTIKDYRLRMVQNQWFIDSDQHRIYLANANQNNIVHLPGS